MEDSNGLPRRCRYYPGAQLAKDSPGIFDKSHFGYQENVDSLSLLVTNHSQYILDALTTKSGDYTGSVSDPNSQAYITNGTHLATLLKTTLFNPDSTYRGLLEGKVTQYASGLKDQVLNKTGPVANGVHTNASTHLAMLFGSLDEGVRLGYTQIAADQKAKKELWGMALDIAVGAPGHVMVGEACQQLDRKASDDNPNKEYLSDAPDNIFAALQRADGG